MASRQKLAAVKTLKSKKVKASKVAQYLADTKHVGEEPTILHDRRLEGLELLRFLNWYNYMCTKSDARDYIETYLKNTGRNKELKLHKTVPDTWVSLQAGWLARIMTRGGVVNIDKFNKFLKESLEHVGNSDTKEVKPKPQIKEIIKTEDKGSILIGELDENIDKVGFNFDVYEWLTKKGATASSAKKVKEFFKPIADEAVEVTKRGADPQLIEGYKTYTKTQLKARAEFYTKLIQDCDRFADTTTKRRIVKTKKVKTVSIDKKLKGFKIQTESKEYKLVSVDPTKIVGASELWTFNTKYKTLTVFKTTDSKTLDIKGASIIGYDEVTSSTYRLGRNTESQLQAVLNSTRKSITKILTKLKTANMQHRSGENTILLKVF